MEEQLQRGEFRLLEREEYVNIVCDQLELLPPELIVQRVTGDGEKEALIGPQWSLKKNCVSSMKSTRSWSDGTVGRENSIKK